ncbi:MAG TPA: carbohydrate ABC transporter permease [Clostridiales bacterium]|nr:carbohydrate ABC transporter permease [Clostridiales bacterium]
MAMKKRFEDATFDILNYIFMICIVFITLYPFYYVMVLSFNEGLDASRGGVFFWPRKFTLENYKVILSENKWLNSFFITVARTAVGTFSGVLFTSMVAFGLSQRRLLFRKFYIVFTIIAMYFYRGLIPYYILLKELRLINSFLVYIVPQMLNIFFALVMISFFREIPEELQESAAIDGANDAVIFFKIILPVSVPVLAAVSLFQAVWHWNEWQDAAFFVREARLRTMSYFMMEVINKSMVSKMARGGLSEQAALGAATTSTSQSVQMTSIIIAIAPIIMVYPFLQKYFIKGIMIGSIKG